MAGTAICYKILPAMPAVLAELSAMGLAFAGICSRHDGRSAAFGFAFACIRPRSKARRKNAQSDDDTRDQLQ